MDIILWLQLFSFKDNICLSKISLILTPLHTHSMHTSDCIFLLKLLLTFYKELLISGNFLLLKFRFFNAVQKQLFPAVVLAGKLGYDSCNIQLKT